MQVTAGAREQRLTDYARERLEAALADLINGGSDAVLGEAEAAVMALHVLYGHTEPITLVPEDILDDVDRPEPVCICPSDLVARGGFRSGCPVHHVTTYQPTEGGRRGPYRALPVAETRFRLG